MRSKKEAKMTEKQLQDYRRDNKGNVYGYKHSYCEFHDCCDYCNKKVRFLCKVISKIEILQEKIIFKICK